MFGLNPFARPRSSFERPVPLVLVDPDDEPDFTVCFRKEWLPYILGSLQQLKLQTTWATSDAEQIATEQARAMSLTSLFIQGCEDANMRLQQDPENACILQVSYDEGETWETLLDTSECGAVGPQGPQGDTGLQGLQGPTGDTGEIGLTGPMGGTGPAGQSGTTSNNAPSPTGEDSEPKRCGVARGVTQWLIEKFGDSLDAFQALVALGRALEVAASGMIDAVPVVGAFIDAAMDYAQEIADWDVANLKACVTEEFEDAVFCFLYCRLGNDGVITDEIYTAFMTDCLLMAPCALGITLVGQTFAAMCLAIGPQNVRNRAYIFSTPSDECPPCESCPPDWESILDFTTDDYSEIITVVSGTYDGANGYVGVPASGQFYTVNLQIDFTSATLTFMEMQYSAGGGSGGSAGVAFYVNGPSWAGYGSVGAVGSGANLTHSRTVNATTANGLLSIGTGTTNAPCYAEKWTLRGTGTKPSELP